MYAGGCSSVDDDDDDGDDDDDDDDEKDVCHLPQGCVAVLEEVRAEDGSHHRDDALHREEETFYSSPMSRHNFTF